MGMSSNVAWLRIFLGYVPSRKSLPLDTKGVNVTGSLNILQMKNIQINH